MATGRRTDVASIFNIPVTSVRNNKIFYHPEFSTAWLQVLSRSRVSP